VSWRGTNKKYEYYLNEYLGSVNTVNIEKPVF